MSREPAKGKKKQKKKCRAFLDKAYQLIQQM